MKTCKCDNCGWTGDMIPDLSEIPYLAERLDPGSIVPAGECPDCRALVYIVPEPKSAPAVNQSAGKGIPAD